MLIVLRAAMFSITSMRQCRSILDNRALSVVLRLGKRMYSWKISSNRLQVSMALATRVGSPIGLQNFGQEQSYSGFRIAITRLSAALTSTLTNTTRLFTMRRAEISSGKYMGRYQSTKAMAAQCGYHEGLHYGAPVE
jgi:hypothetical protein